MNKLALVICTAVVVLAAAVFWFLTVFKENESEAIDESSIVQKFDYSQNTEVRLIDNESAITNPGMGWNFAYFSDDLRNFGTTLHNDDYLDWFPCDIVYFRLGWNLIEPEEGKYNWEFTDKVAEEWRKRGKRVAYSWNVCYPGEQAAPLWLKEAGAQGVEYDVIAEAAKWGFNYKLEWMPPTMQERYKKGEKTWVPNYDDPVFLEKLEGFLEAAAERYDGKDWVEFVEVGSLGSWGEGHIHMSWPAKITDEMRLTHIKLWRKHFKKTTVFVNDDLADTKETINYSLENGLGMADWSIQVDDGNGKERGVNKEQTDRFWKTTPVLLENHPTTPPKRLYLQAMEAGHASYLRLHSDPYFAFNESVELIQAMNLRLGYRLQFPKIQFNSVIKPGGMLSFSFSMRNAGVAPCYRGGYPILTLKDKDGKVVLNHVISDFDVKALMPGKTADSAEPVQGSADIKISSDIRKGKYDMFVAVGDKVGQPVYNLPYDGGDDERRYLVGEVVIQ